MRFIVMKKVILLSLTLLAISVAMPVSAIADNSTIPHALLDAREHLLKEREQLMVDRSDINTKLNFLSSSRTQIDKALTGNSLNRQGLQDARSKLIIQISRLQMWLAHTEKDLGDNDKDLNLVETEMKQFACMNLN
jgi:chromosome segregation ATPase